MFKTFLGNQTLVVIYQKDKGVTEAFNELLIALSAPLNKTIKTADFTASYHVRKFDDLRPRPWLEFYKYSKLNLYATSKNFKLRPFDFAKVIEYNLKEIDKLEDGDIVSFDRTYYHHHAVLTGTLIESVFFLKKKDIIHGS